MGIQTTELIIKKAVWSSQAALIYTSYTIITSRSLRYYALEQHGYLLSYNHYLNILRADSIAFLFSPSARSSTLPAARPIQQISITDWVGVFPYYIQEIDLAEDLGKGK